MTFDWNTQIEETTAGEVIICKVCGETFDTENEDEMVSETCMDCAEFGADYGANFDF